MGNTSNEQLQGPEKVQQTFQMEIYSEGEKKKNVFKEKRLLGVTFPRQRN